VREKRKVGVLNVFSGAKWLGLPSRGKFRRWTKKNRNRSKTTKRVSDRAATAVFRQLAWGKRDRAIPRGRQRRGRIQTAKH